MHISLVHVSGTLSQALIDEKLEDLYNCKLNTETARSYKSFNTSTQI